MNSFLTNHEIKYTIVKKVGEMMKKELIYVHLSILLFSLSGIIGQYVSIDAIYVTLARVFFSSLFLYILMRFHHESITVKKEDLTLLIVSGMILAFHWFTFLKAIQLSYVAIGTITFSTFPLFLLIFNSILFHEKISMTHFMLGICMIFGIFLTIPELSFNNQTTIAIIIGLVSSIAYAILQLFQKVLINRYHSRLICFYQQLTATIVLFPFLINFKGSVSINEWLALIALGVICTALGHSLYVSSLKKIRVESASMISSMESVYGIILAFLLLHENITLQTLLGGAIILLSATYISIKESKGEHL